MGPEGLEPVHPTTSDSNNLRDLSFLAGAQSGAVTVTLLDPMLLRIINAWLGVSARDREVILRICDRDGV